MSLRGHRIITHLLALACAALPWAGIADAAPCAAHNLETEPGSPMPKIPVYDQDGIGICYAYSASELMNAYLIKKNPKAGLQIHPALAAIRYAEGELKDGGELSGGHIGTAINACRGKDAFSYSSIQSSLNEIGSRAGMSEAQALEFIERLGKMMSDPSVQAQARVKAMHESKPRASEGRSGVAVADAASFAVRPVPPSSMQINSQIRHLAYERLPVDGWCTANQKSALEGFALSSPVGNAIQIASCSVLNPGARMPPPAIPEARQYNLLGTSDQQIKKLVRDYFDGPKGKLPLGIGFCSKVLSDPSARKITRTQDASGKIHGKIKDDCGGHAVLLVGTRPKGNSCEYLMRNSWGGNFSSSNKHSCLCKNTQTQGYIECPGTGTVAKTIISKGKPATVQSPIQDRAHLKIVSCWIPEDEMAPNIKSATVLNDL